MLTNAPVGEHVAPYMAHPHQNRGDVWLWKSGWINLSPARGPAPTRGAAVAASGGFANAETEGDVRRIVQSCVELSAASAQHVDVAQRPQACFPLSTRLLMMDQHPELAATGVHLPPFVSAVEEVARRYLRDARDALSSGAD